VNTTENNITTDAEVMKRIEKHLEKIIMYSRILQAYKTPGLSFKEIRELETIIMKEYEE